MCLRAVLDALDAQKSSFWFFLPKWVHFPRLAAGTKLQVQAGKVAWHFEKVSSKRKSNMLNSAKTGKSLN